MVGLFLLGTRWRPLLLQVTLFTIAHSVTLGLSMLGIVSLPSSIVEPLIAFSIAYVAVENLFTTELSPWRGALVFLFGLLHGLGFAGVLGELGMPRGQFGLALVSFNVGVELGQLSVIALADARRGLVAPVAISSATGAGSSSPSASRSPSSASTGPPPAPSVEPCSEHARSLLRATCRISVLRTV